MAIAAVVALLATVIYSAAEQWQKDHHEQAEYQRLQNDLRANKQDVIKTASTLVAQHNFSPAIDLLEIYDRLKDPELLRVKNQARAGLLENQLRATPLDDHVARLEVLTEMLKLRPDESELIRQRDREKDFVERGRLAEEARAQRVAKLSTRSLCQQLRQHSGELTYSREFTTRGGRLEYLSYVAKKEIQIGMNEFEIDCAWGPPERVHRTVFGDTVEKQMVYGDNYVYTRNGVMTSFQDSR